MAQGRLIASVPFRSVGAVARSYDNAGNTTAIGGIAKEFNYDDTGRMSQVMQNAIVQRNYAYNGKGEQVRKYAGTTNTYTVYDESGHWLGDYDNTGVALQQAIWLDDLPVGLIANGNQLRYIEPDHLGTPRVVIEVARNVPVWTWDLKSEAFGNGVQDQDPDGDANPFMFSMRFPGQRYDAASGLNYNYFRDYDATAGRYAESDPVGLKAGYATYSYVLQNPWRYADPFGLQVQVCRRPADLPWPLSQTDHYWLMTSTQEAGMGPADGRVPARDGRFALPGVPVQVNNHQGEHQGTDSICEVLPDVDESCVDKNITLGKQLGLFGAANNCQTFTARVVNTCRNPDSPRISGMISCLVSCQRTLGMPSVCDILCR